VSIKDARNSLATALGAVAFLPERINPPIALLTAGDPYVEQETFYDRTANFVVTLVVAKATSEVATDALDDYIDTTLDGLPEDSTLEKVGPPFLLEWNGATYLATKIYINQNI
jgi:hypothetical protein